MVVFPFGFKGVYKCLGRSVPLTEKQFSESVKKELSTNGAKVTSQDGNLCSFKGKGLNFLFLGNVFDLIEHGDIQYTKNENPKIYYNVFLKPQIYIVNICMTLLLLVILFSPGNYFDFTSSVEKIKFVILGLLLVSSVFYFYPYITFRVFIRKCCLTK